MESSTAQGSIVVFGGTSEGRELVEWLVGDRGRSASVVVCTATEYGGELVSGLDGVRVVQGRLDVDGMEALMRECAAQVVVDATHPYATAATDNIRTAARACGVEYLRLLREGQPEDQPEGQPEGAWLSAADVEEAVEILNERAGNILLTTGSKDLAAYMSGVAGARERIYARILPAAESLLMAHELDVPLAHIVAMQGPFSADLNCALIREYDIRILVTKASGARGGFWEKVKAARECGIELLVIERPRAEEGLGFEQVRSLLVQRVSRSMQGGN